MNVLYTLVSIGSAVVVVAVPYPDRATRISHKGHAIKYFKKKKKKKKIQRYCHQSDNQSQPG